MRAVTMSYMLLLASPSVLRTVIDGAQETVFQLYLTLASPSAWYPLYVKYSDRVAKT